MRSLIRKGSAPLLKSLAEEGTFGWRRRSGRIGENFKKVRKAAECFGRSFDRQKNGRSNFCFCFVREK